MRAFRFVPPPPHYFRVDGRLASSGASPTITIHGRLASAKAKAAEGALAHGTSSTRQTETRQQARHTRATAATGRAKQALVNYQQHRSGRQRDQTAGSQTRTHCNSCNRMGEATLLAQAPTLPQLQQAEREQEGRQTRQQGARQELTATAATAAQRHGGS